MQPPLPPPYEPTDPRKMIAALIAGGLFVVLLVGLWAMVTIRSKDSAAAAPLVRMMPPIPHVVEERPPPQAPNYEPLTGHADPGAVVYFWNRASGVGPQVLFTILDPLAVQLDDGDSEMLVQYPDGTTEFKLRRAFTVGTDFYWVRR